MSGCEQRLTIACAPSRIVRRVKVPPQDTTRVEEVPAARLVTYDECDEDAVLTRSLTS